MLLAWAVLNGGTDRFDGAAVLWLRGLAARGGPDAALLTGEFMVDVTGIGSKPALGVFGLLIAGFLALLRRWRDLAFVAASLMGGLELSGFFKHLFGRVRPDLVAHMVEEQSLSFPSSHATYAAIAYLTFVILLWRIVPGRAGRVYLTVAAALLVVLVGFSRVYLGVHYPSDVVAGWCLGAAWTLACWLLVDSLARR